MWLALFLGSLHTFTNDVCQFLICAICVRIMGSQWIIFFFIAPLLELWSLVFCFFEIHWVVPHKVIELFKSSQGRVSLDDTKIQSCGELCLIACYGIFGTKGMLKALRDVNKLCQRLSLSFSFFLHTPRLECGLSSFFSFFPSCFT